MSLIKYIALTLVTTAGMIVGWIVLGPVLIAAVTWLSARVLANPNLGMVCAYFFLGFGVGSGFASFRDRKYFKQMSDLAKDALDGWREALEIIRESDVKTSHQTDNQTAKAE